MQLTIQNDPIHALTSNLTVCPEEGASRTNVDSEDNTLAAQKNSCNQELLIGKAHSNGSKLEALLERILTGGTAPSDLADECRSIIDKIATSIKPPVLISKTLVEDSHPAEEPRQLKELPKPVDNQSSNKFSNTEINLYSSKIIPSILGPRNEPFTYLTTAQCKMSTALAAITKSVTDPRVKRHEWGDSGN